MGIPENVTGLNERMISLIKHKAWNLIGSIDFTESDRDDVEQDLALHLLKCLPNFDPDKGHLMKFVNHVIDHKIASMIQARKTRHYDYRMHSYSLNEPCMDIQGFTSERGDELDEDEYLIAIGQQSRPTLDLVEMFVDLDRVVSKLPLRLKELCQHLQTGNVTDVSRATGASRCKVYSDKAKLRTIFREASLGDYL